MSYLTGMAMNWRWDSVAVLDSIFFRDGRSISLMTSSVPRP